MSLAEEAQKLLPYQFKSSPKINNLLKAMIKPLDELLEQIKLLKDNHLLNAEGEMLNIMGRTIGQKRNQMSNNKYRVWLRTRIKLNNSSGTAGDIENILNILGIKNFIHEYKGTVLISFSTKPTYPLKPLFDVIQTACPITIRCIYKKAFDAPIFAFDSKEAFSGKLAEYYGENYE